MVHVSVSGRASPTIAAATSEDKGLNYHDTTRNVHSYTLGAYVLSRPLLLLTRIL